MNNNPFGTAAMSEGYATARPALHGWIVERAMKRAGGGGGVRDVGCGAGLSTAAVGPWARRAVGMEPAVSMLITARRRGAKEEFVAGQAERLPFADQSFDWLTAAGSLNYVDLPAFFGEAGRVLRARGGVVVYDFAPGRKWRTSRGLEDWFEEFVGRYPSPPSEAKFLDPSVLGGLNLGFQVEEAEEFETGIPMERDFYRRYMMTESNVAYAIRRGIAASEIEGWIEETMPVAGWGEVLFRGYWAIMRAWN
ncbi:MAG: class I SAM-dependent methyltransferase [Acidobacteriota bacterium]